jgi:hypothetical protein
VTVCGGCQRLSTFNGGVQVGVQLHLVKPNTNQPAHDLSHDLKAAGRVCTPTHISPAAAITGSILSLIEAELMLSSRS